MKENSENTYHLILGMSVFIIIILIFYFDNNIRNNELKDINRNVKYTIGYITGVKKANSYSPYLLFVTCKIKGEEYNYTEETEIAAVANTFCFFVKFSSENPGKSKIIFDIKVPDSIKEAPPEGWSPEEFEKLFGEELPN